MIGVVAIGRNEGDKLRVCLESALRASDRVVYVDSGSSDGSVAMASALGAHVVELDLAIPFTAARARNEGFDALLSKTPDLEFVQFIDGDCEIVDGWIDRARAELIAKPQAAIVAGRRRERFPSASVYNKLCDMEWDTPIGKARACGGDALIRVKAFRQVSGYNPAIIAGEEPEMCVRLRANGWEIWRIDAQMTLHDAAMTKFYQWWKRSVRSGHAFAEGYAMHGAPPELHNAKQVRSIWILGLVIPTCFIILLTGSFVIGARWRLVFGFGAIWLYALYVLVFGRIANYMLRRKFSRKDAVNYAFFVILGKLPQLLGILKYHLSRLSGQRTALIEYKAVPSLDARD